MVATAGTGDRRRQPGTGASSVDRAAVPVPAAGGPDAYVVAACALVTSRLTGERDIALRLEVDAGPARGSGYGRSAAAVPLTVHVDPDCLVSGFVGDVERALAALLLRTRGRRLVRVRSTGPVGSFAAALDGPAAVVCDQGGTEVGHARRVAGYLGAALAAFARAGSRLRHIDMLPADERRRLVVDWNDTARPYPRGASVHALVERQARARPDAVAVVHGDEALTYRGLDRRARSWAARLREVGVAAEDRVGVRMPRGTELVAVLLGVLKAGAAYLPLDPDYPPERLAFMVRDSGMAALVTDEASGPVPDGARVLHPGGDPLRTGLSSARTPTSEGHAAYVLYTSGSTGHPKGVVITHANATDLLHWSHETFGDTLERVLATTSICFDCSVLEIFGPLTAGGTAVLAETALAVGRVETGHGVRLMHSVPSVMAELMRFGRLPPSVETVLLGGEPPWPRLVDEVYGRGTVARLLNLYGPTECTSYATMATIGPGSAGPPPIGRPVANTRVTLLDATGGLAPAGAAAEIHIGGRGVARGYLNRPALTAERFVPDATAPGPGERAYRTGDLARHDPDTGVLTYLGRLDDQVKVRGVRVEPGEVERALLAEPSVGEAVVTAPADGDSRVRLVAFVVPAGTAGTSERTLRNRLASTLPAALVPDSFVVLDHLPRLPNGKVDRSRLIAPPPVIPASTTHDEPRDELERQLARVWAEAFDLDGVGIHDDFYDMGGHSLSAVRIRGRIADRLGIELPMPVVLGHRTIASLAAALRDASASEDRSAPGPALPPHRPPSAGSAALSPNQRTVLARARRAHADPTLHLPLCVRLTGDVHVAALSDAVTELVRRHDVLRAAVRPGDTEGAGEDALLVAEPAAVALPMVDLSGLPVARQADVADRLSTESARAAFDLTRAPMIHPLVLRLADDDHVVSVTLHQLAGDVWSMAGVGRQLLELYGSATAARPVDAAVPLVQYTDWARQQVRWLEGAGAAAQRRFWHDRMREVPALVTPGSGRRGPAATARTGTRDFGLPSELLGRLEALGGEESGTLYIVLLAAFQVLVGTWSGQDRFAVGCPTTGRVHPDLARTVGPLLDAVVLRADLTGDPTFRDLLRRARDEAWQAYAHEDLPFAELVRELDADTDPTRHPLYQTSIVVHYLTEPMPPPAGVGLDDFGQRPPAHTALDLELAIYVDGAGGAACALAHREDVLDATTAQGLAATFGALLPMLADAPDRPVKDLDVHAVSAR